ncbi:hypothetical protein ECDEC6E_3567 [Escherichia coli DEC6E]|nr:hypothetical protein ECDEC6D_3600 [Escherichia coli DEC6D]EHV71708.1 hypothetical protein ECDEC6E_3567 [Escherichia coli DEC6E]EHY00091.1 hypothetical protein ECDEC15B_4370 [Escherichia coli DEC15B]KDY72643.1 hypothetical protein AD32_4821 [Escherichia coli 2-460-02_S4_C3]
MTDTSIDIMQIIRTLFYGMSQNNEYSKLITIVNVKIQKIIPQNTFDTAS